MHLSSSSTKLVIELYRKKTYSFIQSVYHTAHTHTFKKKKRLNNHQTVRSFVDAFSWCPWHRELAVFLFDTFFVTRQSHAPFLNQDLTYVVEVPHTTKILAAILHFNYQTNPSKHGILKIIFSSRFAYKLMNIK